MDKRYGESLDHWHQKPKKKELSKSEVLFEEAKRLNSEKRYSDALTLVNVAIESDETNFKYYTCKGIILENLGRYSEAEKAYDEALELNDSDDVYENKARMLYKWANSLNDKTKALNLIDEAIQILPISKTDEYFERFWYLKGSIYDCLAQPI